MSNVIPARNNPNHNNVVAGPKVSISWETYAVVDLNVQDPWKENYKFVWDYTKDAIYIFCSGPDKSMVGTDAAALLDSDSEATNADNYSISVTYAVDGLSIKTTGYDKNINR